MTEARDWDEFIEETTVGDLDGVRVAVGTVVRSGRYPLADGSGGMGPAAILALPDESSIWVGAGSVVAVEGTTWTIVRVDAPSGENGEVFLRRGR